MRKDLLPVLVFLHVALAVFSKPVQAQDSGFQYFRSGSDEGYANSAGDTLRPQIGRLHVMKFKNIVAITDSLRKSYFLLHTGQRVGIDSVYEEPDFPNIPNTLSCEREGKILFQDRITLNCGFLDSLGKVIIPAIYGYALPFTNGLTVAHFGGYWVRESNGSFLNVRLRGGNQVLINANNEVLFEDSLATLALLDLRSFQVDAPSFDSSTHRQFKGDSGHTYTFLDHKKEFEKWYVDQFYPALLRGRKWVSAYIQDRIEVFSGSDLALLVDHRRALRRHSFKFQALASLHSQRRVRKTTSTMLRTSDGGLEDNWCQGAAGQENIAITVDVKSRTPSQKYKCRIDFFTFVKTADGYELEGIGTEPLCYIE